LETTPTRQSEAPPTTTQQPPTFTGILPAYRPFGIVFIVVWTVGWALTWLFSSFTVSSMMAREALFERSLPAEAVALFFLSVLLSFLSILSFTGAIGLWLLTRWGRNLVAWLQFPSAILGIIAMGISSIHQVQASGLAGIFILSGIVVLLISVVILFYLLNPKMDDWFRTR